MGAVVDAQERGTRGSAERASVPRRRRRSRAARRPRAASPVAQASWYLGDLACPIGPHTWESAVAAAHTAIAAAEAVLAGEHAAYALCRPPGHHATADRAAGFCYLNNAAIAAEFLLQHFQRVAILDVDTHHGDGTQAIFYRRADVQYVSVHVDPTGYYPFFSGYADEYGAGEGEGFNLNIPLQPGSGDAEFLDALDDAFGAIRAHGSEALVVSVGFDAHERDPLSVLKVTNDGYRRIGDAIAALKLPTVIVQEGGYNLDHLGGQPPRLPRRLQPRKQALGSAGGTCPAGRLAGFR